MTLFWAAVLAALILLYVLLDGFDLGVGILFAFNRNEGDRRRMLSAISPVWDGNETWLVLIGTVLFGAFPRIYATLLSAFYLPITFMIGALILRGVAFEFRENAAKMRWLWDAGFAAGSTVAAFVQGMTIGALVEGRSFVDGRYVGGAFGWLGPFACLCGLGLCLGYSLLGACWLVGKSEGALRERIYRYLLPLLAAVLVFLAAAFAYALLRNFPIMQRWIERPYLLLFPAVGASATLALVSAIRRKRDVLPFRMACLIFLSAFATLAASFWPYMIPYQITIDQAAGPASSLNFMFWGAGLLIFPLTLAYTAVVYRVFSGKLIRSGDDG